MTIDGVGEVVAVGQPVAAGHARVRAGRAPSRSRSPNAQMVPAVAADGLLRAIDARASRDVSAAASSVQPDDAAVARRRRWARCRSRSIRCAASQPLEPVRVDGPLRGDAADVLAADRRPATSISATSATSCRPTRRGRQRRAARSTPVRASVTLAVQAQRGVDRLDLQHARRCALAARSCFATPATKCSGTVIELHAVAGRCDEPRPMTTRRCRSASDARLAPTTRRA